MKDEQMRKEFEEWAKKNDCPIDKIENNLGDIVYKNWVVEKHFEAYQAAKASAWRDIKDAPKDGFILATPCFGTSKSVYSIYWEHGKRKSGWKMGGIWLTAEPKYWQPLPTPPNTNNKG